MNFLGRALTVRRLIALGLSGACALLAVMWPTWRLDLQAQSYGTAQITDGGRVSGVVFTSPSNEDLLYCVHFSGVDAANNHVPKLYVGGGGTFASPFAFNGVLEQFVSSANTNGTYVVGSYLSWSDCMSDTSAIDTETFYRTARDDSFSSSTPGHWAVTPGVHWTDSLPWYQSSAVGPTDRTNHGMAYDAERREVVLFGGGMGAQEQETWVWDGTTWTQRFPWHSPPARSFHAMAYDAARRDVVLFGGLTPSGVTGDTWTWDGTDWTERTPATAPPPVYAHAMVYDAARTEVMMFGGFDGSCLCRDTWVWNGADWTLRTPANSPPPLMTHQMAYDAGRQQVVLFGGHHGTKMRDTWLWDGVDWTQVVLPDVPPWRQSHAMAYSATEQKVLLFGGTDGVGLWLGDTWSWTGHAWVREDPPTRPSPRSGAAMAFDERSGQIVLFGDRTTSSLPGETWVWPERPTTTAGTIVVTTNLSGAGFTLTGPSTNISIVAPYTQSATTGAYTVVFDAIAGYKAPPSQTQVLTSGATITFAGSYDGDIDGDGVVGTADNCPTANPSQADSDFDGIGDACDPQWSLLDDDFDDDALKDSWEIFGYIHSNGRFVDLPGMGADPLKKDIFVELDYMDCRVAGSDCASGDTHNERLTDEAIRLVTRAFERHGIELHIDQSEAIPHQEVLGSVDHHLFGDSYNWDAFDNIARSQRPELVPISHYAIAGHRVPMTNCNSQATTTGVSKNFAFFIAVTYVEYGAGDFLLAPWTQACPGQDPVNTFLRGNTPDATKQAGNFMHELGHNLGLHHGGDDEDNYKPNYLSVMNYSFSLGIPACSPFGCTGADLDGDLVPDDAQRVLDYSDGEQADLSYRGAIGYPPSGGMDESVGVSPGTFGGTLHGLLPRTLYVCPSKVWTSEYVGREIDWDCDGSIEAAVRSEVAACLTDQNGTEICPKGRTLNDHDDWGALIFDGGRIGDSSLNRTLPLSTPLVEIPIEPLLTFQATDTDGDSIVDEYDNCPLVSNPGMADADGDGYGDACEPNYAPMANAGADILSEATSPLGAKVTLVGTLSSDHDRDPLSYQWSGAFGQLSGPTVTVQLALGTHPITLRVTDPSGAAAADDVVVTVVDSAPPTITDLPAAIVTVATSSGGATVTWSPLLASDAVDPAPTSICVPASGSLFPLGQTLVTCAATDGSGNSTSGTFTVTVRDLDSDGDGIGNLTDPDDDNDGVADVNDAFPLDAAEWIDTDGDGIGNNADADDDNDGVLDANDAFPLNTAESVDTDRDGIGNNADRDDDNDGVLDTVDPCPLVVGAQGGTGCPLNDVSAQVGITYGGFTLNRTTGRYVQTLTLRNNGSTTVSGPISVVLSGLSSNAMLYQPTGTTTVLYASSRYKNLAAASLAPGTTATVVLEFTKTGTAGITYAGRVIAGQGTR